ncbi:nesprin-3 [Gastrophryne carolinensis]
MSQLPQDEFETCLEKAEAWMKEIHERLRENDNTQGPRSALEARLRETEKICALEPEGKLLLNMVLGKAEALLGDSSDDEKHDIHLKLGDIKAKFEETITYMTHCHSRIEWVWLHWNEYLRARDDFAAWVHNMTLLLEPDVELQLGLKEKGWQYEQALVILRDVKNQHKLLERLLEEASSLYNRIGDPSVDESVQSAMATEYKAIKKKAQERVKHLEQIWKNHEAYDREINLFKSWLHGVIEKLKRCVGSVSESTETRLGMLQEIGKDVEIGKKQLDVLEVKSAGVIKDTSPLGAETICKDLEELRRTLKELKMMNDEEEEGLLKTYNSENAFLELAEQLEGNINEFRKAIQRLEESLDSGGKVKTEDELIALWKMLNVTKSALAGEEAKAERVKVQLRDLFKFSKDIQPLSDGVIAAMREYQRAKSKTFKLSTDTESELRQIFQNPLREFLYWKPIAESVLETTAVAANNGTVNPESLQRIEKLLEESGVIKERLATLDEKRERIQGVFGEDKTKLLLRDVAAAEKERAVLHSDLLERKERLQALASLMEEFELTFKMLQQRLAALRVACAQEDELQPDIIGKEAQLQRLQILLDDLSKLHTPIKELSKIDASPSHAHRASKLLADYLTLQRTLETNIRNTKENINKQWMFNNALLDLQRWMMETRQEIEAYRDSRRDGGEREAEALLAEFSEKDVQRHQVEAQGQLVMDTSAPEGAALVHTEIKQLIESWETLRELIEQLSRTLKEREMQRRIPETVTMNETSGFHSDGNPHSPPQRDQTPKPKKRSKGIYGISLSTSEDTDYGSIFDNESPDRGPHDCSFSNKQSLNENPNKSSLEEDPHGSSFFHDLEEHPNIGPFYHKQSQKDDPQNSSVFTRQSQGEDHQNSSVYHKQSQEEDPQNSSVYHKQSHEDDPQNSSVNHKQSRKDDPQNSSVFNRQSHEDDPQNSSVYHKQSQVEDPHNRSVFNRQSQEEDPKKGSFSHKQSLEGVSNNSNVINRQSRKQDSNGTFNRKQTLEKNSNDSFYNKLPQDPDPKLGLFFNKQSQEEYPKHSSSSHKQSLQEDPKYDSFSHKQSLEDGSNEGSFSHRQSLEEDPNDGSFSHKQSLEEDPDDGSFSHNQSLKHGSHKYSFSHKQSHKDGSHKGSSHKQSLEDGSNNGSSHKQSLEDGSNKGSFSHKQSLEDGSNKGSISYKQSLEDGSNKGSSHKQSLEDGSNKGSSHKQSLEDGSNKGSFSHKQSLEDGSNKGSISYKQSLEDGSNKGFSSHKQPLDVDPDEVFSSQQFLNEDPNEGSSSHKQSLKGGSNKGSSHKQSLEDGSNKGSSYKQSLEDGSNKDSSHKQSLEDGSNKGSISFKKSLEDGSNKGSLSNKQSLDEGSFYQKKSLKEDPNRGSYSQKKSLEEDPSKGSFSQNKSLEEDPQKKFLCLRLITENHLLDRDKSLKNTRASRSNWKMLSLAQSVDVVDSSSAQTIERSQTGDDHMKLLAEFEQWLHGENTKLTRIRDQVITDNDGVKTRRMNLQQLQARVPQGQKLFESLLLCRPSMAVTEDLRLEDLRYRWMLYKSKLRDSGKRTSRQLIQEPRDVTKKSRGMCWFLQRVCCAALPLQLLLLLLLLLALLLPLVYEHQNCALSNNFARSFNLMLKYDSPPPT